MKNRTSTMLSSLNIIRRISSGRLRRWERCLDMSYKLRLLMWSELFKDACRFSLPSIKTMTNETRTNWPIGRLSSTSSVGHSRSFIHYRQEWDLNILIDKRDTSSLSMKTEKFLMILWSCGWGSFSRKSLRKTCLIERDFDNNGLTSRIDFLPMINI